jgi:hypothetical protein
MHEEVGAWGRLDDCSTGGGTHAGDAGVQMQPKERGKVNARADLEARKDNLTQGVSWCR